jgi:ABC-2 type transport system permease protein
MKFDITSAFAKAFKNKKLKYGGFATLISAGVIAALIVLNLLVDMVPAQVDLSKSRLFTLSPQTQQILGGLQKDVNIYALYQTGKENPIVWEILQKYEQGSRKVHLKAIDPVRNPTFAKKYEKEGETLGDGGLIVESGDTFRNISAYDLVNYSYDSGNPQATSLAVEQRVTGAILYVAGAEMPVIGVLQGHQEQALPYNLTKQLETENYTVQDVNLLVEKQVPQDVKLLLFLSPRRDLSADDLQKITAFLNAGGTALIAEDYTEQELPRLQELLGSYGVEVRRTIVVEGDSRRYASIPLFLVPELGSHEIASPLRAQDLLVLFPYSQAVQTKEVRRRTLENTPLLTTSPSSFGKVDLSTQVDTKAPGDLSGPFDLAVAIVDGPVGEVSKGTRLVVFGTSQFLDSSLLDQVPGNANLFLNSINWLSNRQESISVRPKSLLSLRLRLTGFTSLLLSGIVVLLIPLSIFGVGLGVWLRRRHL